MEFNILNLLYITMFLSFQHFKFIVFFILQLINYFGYLCLSFALAYICYIFFQVPYMYVESLILRKHGVKKNISVTDIESDFKSFDSKQLESNCVSVTAKSVKRQFQTLSTSAIKDNCKINSIQINQKLQNILFHLELQNVTIVVRNRLLRESSLKQYGLFEQLA